MLVIDGKTRKLDALSRAAAARALQRARSLARATRRRRITGIDAVVERDSVRCGGDAVRTGRTRRLHAVSRRGAWRRLWWRSDGARPGHCLRPLGRPAVARDGVQAETAGRRARIADQATSIRSSTRCASSRAPREIAMMREVTRITGLGIMEAMREAAPGRFEYELTAASEWVFRALQLAGAWLLSAVGDWSEHRLHPLSPRPAQAAGRRHRAVRLRAGLQVLHLGHQPGVSRQRQVHAPPARVLHDLPAALSGADGVDSSRVCTITEVASEAGREDGRDHRRLHVHRSEDQGRSDEVRGAVSDRQAAQRPRPRSRHGSARRHDSSRVVPARRALHDRAARSRSPTRASRCGSRT